MLGVSRQTRDGFNSLLKHFLKGEKAFGDLLDNCLFQTVITITLLSHDIFLVTLFYKATFQGYSLPGLMFSVRY